jgi:hypothetical protein
MNDFSAVSPDPSGITEDMIEKALEAAMGFDSVQDDDRPVDDQYLREQMRASLTAVLAGRSVVDHREPDQRYDRSAVWCVGPFDLVARGDETIHFTWHSNIPPRQTMGVHTVQALAASLLAALAENERLAAESPVTAGGVE